MSSLFGGKKDDGGANALAQANIQIAQENRAAEAKRLQDQQDAEAKKQADLAASEKAQQDTASKSLADAQAEEAKRANALATTGGTPTLQDLQSQKLAKASAGAALGLPGFNDLQNRFGTSKSVTAQNGQNAQQQGFNGQGNSLVSKKPVVAAAGGQRYY